MADTIYNRFFANLMNKEVDLEADTIKVALLTSSYTINKDHNTWAEVSANEVSGTGYTAGGATLANKSVTQDDTNDQATFDADDVTWSSSTITARYAVLYDNTLTNDDLLAIFDFGSDQSSSNGDFTLQFSASGILALSQS